MTADTDPDTAPDTGQPDNSTLWRAGFRVLLTVTVLVAVVTFALSFYGLNDFGRTGMGLPVWLSPLVPIGVDLFSLCGIAATFMLRQARTRIRAYAWLVFLVPTGLSVAGNMAHAEHRQLGTAGVIGAAVAPVVLALSAHLVVVVRRHVERPDTDPDTPQGADIGVSAQVNGSRPPTEADTEKVTAMARALAVRSAGGTIAEQADAAGVDERTVRRWFGQAQRRPATRPAARRGAPVRTPKTTVTEDAGPVPAGQ